MRKRDSLSADQFWDIQIPALIIWGRQDAIVPLEYGRKLHDAIPGSRLEVLDGCGHAVIWDRADRLRNLVLDFLGQRQ